MEVRIKLKSSNSIPSTFSYTVLSLACVISVSIAYRTHPIVYARLVHEDQWGEYATSGMYGLAVIVLAILVGTGGTKLQKLSWSLIGIVAFFIAGEEISWGQRILNFDTPHILLKYNIQEEITLHNLLEQSSIKQAMRIILVYILPIWLLFSLVIDAKFPAQKVKLLESGIPLVASKLFPVFLLPAYYFGFQPMLKYDEFGELFSALAVSLWAFDQLRAYGSARTSQVIFFTKKLLSFSSVILLSLVVSQFHWSYGKGFHNEFAGRLNRLAEKEYMVNGHYEQAEKVFEYLYQNSEYLRDYSHLNYATVLQALGKDSEAKIILVHAIANLGAKLESNPNSRNYRLYGSTSKLLGREDKAREAFSRALELDKSKLVSSGNGKRASLLFSIAKNYKMLGETELAVKYALKSHQKQPTRRQSFILKWIEMCKLDQIPSSWLM